ncbi:MAG TPA: putative manganese-dependent inorganic diphosphatase [Spirochaetia bacterium]|nr:putative manganese-dependent inorganic diphosphatase [Spirochaetales bacterium]HRW24862.1 putative manganese-dependent inorganic diphosphatase [Spirochaetia bacterium]
MTDTTYVIGHKNPDTDSVVSAAAYAHLKRELGFGDCVAARAGKMSPQAEYVFERFGAPFPAFIPDLVPKVEYYMGGPAIVVGSGTPLWDALATMNQSGQKALPIVDEDGRYRAMLHYSSFAQNILKKINPHKKAVIPTSVGRLEATIKAQPVCAFAPDEMFKARVLVAALETDSFKRHLDAEAVDSVIVIVGDRADVQRYSIESKVRAMIVTNGALLSRELKELAEANGVSVLISPYDTSSTSLLVIYSTPVETMGDDTIKPVRTHETLKRAREAIADSPSRSVPVLDDDGRVVGLFDEGDLIREPNVSLILVDHNELGQAVDGADNYRILEVIDHHRLGAFSTRYPITFINRVVGSTSTIVASMYRDAKVPIPKPIASLLLAGILSDTLILKSATATDADREAAEYLSNIADLDVEAFGRDIMSSASLVAKKPVAEIVRLDVKEYGAADRSFTVSQVEVHSPDEILERADEVASELAALRASGDHYFSALMVTDITELSSVLFVEGDKDFVSMLRFPRLNETTFELKDVLSRKKQLVPLLIELTEKALGD